MADHPLAHLRCPEDTRIHAFKQNGIIALGQHRCAALAAAVLWVVCLLALFAPLSVRAEAPGIVPVAIVPADGNARGVQLRAQAVDIIIRQDETGVWADTSLWVLLNNPGRKAAAVPIALPGPQAAPGSLPGNLTLTLGKTPLELQPLAEQDGQPRVGPTTPITVPLRGSVMLRVRYQQAITVTADVATYIYPLTSTARWPGTPESLRVTVRFAAAVSPEQFLAQAPPPTRREPDGMTWHWEYKKAAEDVGLTFITSGWWAAFTAERTAAAAPDAGLAEHLALAGRYRSLAGLPPSPLAGAADTFERYYPQAVAELKAAIRAAGQDDPMLAAAHLDLAALYRQRGERSEPAAGQSFLQMAAAELENAAAVETSDQAVAATAADLYGQLAGSADARGDAVLAEQHRARQAALRTTGSLPSEEALAQAAALARAVQATEAGDLAAARKLIAGAFGPAAATLPDAPPPIISHARATVASGPDRRTITLQLGADGDVAALATLLEQTAADLRPLAQVETEGDRLTLTLAGMTPAQWAAAQARLAAALPPAPELALLADVLRPRVLTWDGEAGAFQQTERYVESVDLQPAAAAWEAQARRIEQAALTRAGAAEGLPAWLDAAQRERLAGIQRALWAADAAAWRDLAAGSGAEYRVGLGAPGGERQWAVAADTARQLEAQAAAWRYDRLAWAAGGGVLVLALLALAIWRLI